MTRAAIVLSLVALAAPLVAKTPETALTIKVTDLKGNPVDRASVIVRFISGHSVVKMGKATKTQYELRTNQEGVAHFPPLPEGKIRLQIIDPRYQTYGDTVDISGGEKTLDIHLNPPQTQYSAHE
jgi:uncharacterized GH25 family protein